MSQNPDKWRSLNRNNTTPSVIWPGLVLFTLAVLALVTLVAGAEAGIALALVAVASWWIVNWGTKK